MSAGSHPFCRLGIALSSSFLCLLPTFPFPICPHTLGTCCFEGRPCQSTSEWVHPMFVCRILHNPHTSLSSLPAPVLSSPFYTFLPALLFLSLFLPPHAILTSTPSLLPIASPRGTFAPGGCFLCIHHTSVITPGYIEELDNEGRLLEDEYPYYGATEEKCHESPLLSYSCDILHKPPMHHATHHTHD